MSNDLEKKDLELEEQKVDLMAKYMVRGVSKLHVKRVLGAKIVASIIAGIILLFISIFTMSSVIAKESNFVVNAAQPMGASLSLSETGNFDEDGTTILRATGIPNMFNIDGNLDIPSDINDINGSHNGDNYIAYTFYIKNVGDTTVVVNSHIDITLSLLGFINATRVKVYKDGIPVTYAYLSSNGTEEPIDYFDLSKGYTTAFLSDDQVMSEDIILQENQIIKYTIVMWLDGWDP